MAFWLMTFVCVYILVRLERRLDGRIKNVNDKMDESTKYESIK